MIVYILYALLFHFLTNLHHLQNQFHEQLSQLLKKEQTKNVIERVLAEVMGPDGHRFVCTSVMVHLQHMCYNKNQVKVGRWFNKN